MFYDINKQEHDEYLDMYFECTEETKEKKTLYMYGQRSFGMEYNGYRIDVGEWEVWINKIGGLNEK